MDSIFDLVDQRPSLGDAEAFSKAVESLLNQLTTEKAGPKLTVDVLCQGILLWKMHRVPDLHSFISDHRTKWTFENTDVAKTCTELQDYVKIKAISVAQTQQQSTALAVDRSKPKRPRSHTNLTPGGRYEGPTCQNPKCVEANHTAHDPAKCFYDHPELAWPSWIKKNMPGHPHGKPLNYKQEP